MGAITETAALDLGKDVIWVNSRNDYILGAESDTGRSPSTLLRHGDSEAAETQGV